MLPLVENKYWIWISRLPGIGTKTIKKLLSKYGSLNEIYRLTKEKLIEDKIISDRIIEIIIDKKYRENLNKYIEYMEKEKINIITQDDIEYPDKLKQIYDSPMYLFIKGNVSLLKRKSIAIVGSRYCTNYGKIIAKSLAEDLVKNNIIIVSGLAKGIDEFSHIGALKNEESTIAVLGSSIDNIYPKENINLAKKILDKNGLIISEYVIGSKLVKFNFPARNIIISGRGTDY